ncbi:unnamed protein product, partial [Musa acuminata subsp. burmannicoides]
GLFYVEAPPAYSSSSTAYTTITRDQTCQASCKHMTCICYGFFLMMLGTVGLCLFAVRVAHILGHRIFTADTSSVFKDSKYFKLEQSDISREIGWLDPSSTHQQEISSRIGGKAETKHSYHVTEKKLLGKY